MNHSRNISSTFYAKSDKSLYFFKTYNEQNQCKEQYQYWDISWNIRCKGLIIRVKAGETNYGIQYGRVVSIFC